MYLPFKSLPFLTRSPIGIIDGGLWPHDEWLPSPEMNRKMNDFTPARAREGWNKECWYCDKYTDHSNQTWTNQQGTEGWHALIVAQQKFLFACRLRTCVYPMDNYLSLAINCRHSDNADGMPRDEWKAAANQLAGAGERCVGRLCLCTRWKCGGQENRCSKVRRCPRWLLMDVVTTFSAKISKLKQDFPAAVAELAVIQLRGSKCL